MKASFNFPYENTGSANALRVENIQAGYGKPLLAPVTFSMTGGEKLLFSGFNGVGKSTLIKTILGKIPALSGTSTFSPSAKISYFDQDLIWDDPTKTPLQTIQDQFPTMLPKTIRQRLAKAGINAANAQKPMNLLSGGTDQGQTGPLGADAQQLLDPRRADQPPRRRNQGGAQAGPAKFPGQFNFGFPRAVLYQRLAG